MAFIAALHNTTTDEIEGFDLDLPEETARARWARLQSVLAQSGDQVRRTRALTLGLDTPRCSTSCAAGPTTVRRRDPNGASLATRHF